MTFSAVGPTPLSIPNPPVDVILPCLNEAAALPGLLSRIPAGYRPIVADNGSTDGSAEIAARYGAVVVHVPQRGFGAAVHAGLLAATSDIVCVMDADGSLDPVDLAAVTGPLLDGTADLMLGRRAPQGAGAWPLHARIGNMVLSAQLRRRAGVPVHDLGPMRAFRREALLGLGIADRRFGYPLEMVMRAAAAGWRIAEVAVPYYPRSGKSKVTGTVRGTIKAIRDMRRVLAECTPDMVGATTARRAQETLRTQEALHAQETLSTQEVLQTGDAPPIREQATSGRATVGATR
ncbi:MAG TPA: glycosyltransferase family 2 protein [Trebonia sp.]|nr:glycosyltransferase family 2 protein [Trebonia sp.]